MVKKLEIIDTSKWLTPDEVRILLRFENLRTVYEKCHDGSFRSLRRGSSKRSLFLIDPESVAEWQQARMVGKKREQAPAESPLPAGVRRYV